MSDPLDRLYRIAYVVEINQFAAEDSWRGVGYYFDIADAEAAQRDFKAAFHARKVRIRKIKILLPKSERRV